MSAYYFICHLKNPEDTPLFTSCIVYRHKLQKGSIEVFTIIKPGLEISGGPLVRDPEKGQRTS